MTDLERENVELRAALARALEDNEHLKRERDIASSSKGHVVTSSSRPPPMDCGKSPRIAHLEHALDVLESLAIRYADGGCYGEGPDGDEPCACRACEAERALKEVADFRFGGSRTEVIHRFVGARDERTRSGWNPREEKLHRAWATWINDRALGSILCDLKNCGGPGASMFHSCQYPDARDWYVATSVVQWLATNVGMSVLEKAGFTYTQWEEDAAAIDAKRHAQRAAVNA